MGAYNIKILFIICIIIRFALAYLVKIFYDKPLRIVFSILYGILSLGIFYQYIKNDRNVGAFGQKVWWSNYRLIHGIIWGYASISIYNRYKYSYVILLIDTLIGIFGHIYNHYLR